MTTKGASHGRAESEARSQCQDQSSPTKHAAEREHPAGRRRASRSTGRFFVKTVMSGSMSFVMTPHAASRPPGMTKTSKSSKPVPVRALRQQGDHHEELRHVQAITGAVEALVELHQTLRVAKRPFPPRPAFEAPEEKAQDLRQNRRKRPRPQALPQDPRKCAQTQDETRSQRRHAGRKHAGHGTQRVPTNSAGSGSCRSGSERVTGHLSRLVLIVYLVSASYR